MTKKNRILCLLIACVLMLSVFSFCAFAEGDETDGLLLGASGETTAATTAPADTTAATTAPADTTATTATTASTVAKTWLEKNEGLVITLGVIAALVIVFFILWFASSKFKDKVKKFAKDYKSEFKKLVWPTKQQLWKNSLVVVLSIIVIGAFLAALDIGLTAGIHGLRDLVLQII